MSLDLVNIFPEILRCQLNRGNFSTLGNSFMLTEEMHLQSLAELNQVKYLWTGEGEAARSLQIQLFHFTPHRQLVLTDV